MNRSLLLIAGALLSGSLMSAQNAGDWPAYNRTLMGDRFAPQKAITPATAATMHEVCRYDLKQSTSLQTGPVVVSGVMYLTTGHDTIALDAATCAEKWRVHEEYAGGNDVNRGAAVMDGRVFRGTQDGRVLAYDARTGKRLWETPIGETRETVPAALLAWQGLVFAGNVGGGATGKGRIYALDSATGKSVWEQYMVPRGPEDKPRGTAAPAPKVVGTGEAAGGTMWTALSLDPKTGTLFVPGGNPTSDKEVSYTVALDAKTGAYRNSYGAVKHDFHDWEVSAAPALFTAKSGKSMLAEATKDGRVYAVAVPSGTVAWVTPVTTIADESAPLKEGGVHFCPGGLGGSEWNGAAYSPATDMVYAGAVDWCGTAMPGVDGKAPKLLRDDVATATGWVTALNAATGKMAWRFHAPVPVVGGVTPTAGGVVFAGDLAGTLYAFNAKTGDVAWKVNTGGAIGGGIVSYSTSTGAQRIAVTSGMKAGAWPMAKGEPAVVVYGLK